MFIFTTFSNSSAQSNDLHNLKSNTLKIETDYLDVDIQTWENDYINIESEVKINLADGKDGHELIMHNSRTGISIESSINKEGYESMVITTDKEGNKSYTPTSEWNENNGNMKFQNMNFGHEIIGRMTIFIPNDMLVKIESTYGDVHIKGDYNQIQTCSTYGLIEAKLNDVSKMNKVSFKSTYDIVDLTLDKSSDAVLSLNTTYGSIFSDLPLTSNDKNNNKRSNSCMKASQNYVLNDGSVAIDIVTTYDNIYVRAN